MPRLETSDLLAMAVLWEKTGITDLGQSSISGTARQVKARWIHNESLNDDPQDNVESKIPTVVVGVDIPIGSILWEGRLRDLPDDKIPTNDVYEVISIRRNRDVKERNVRRELGLKRYKGELPEETA